MKCKICKSKLKFILKVPNSFRGSSLYTCEKCTLIQTKYSKNYVQEDDPHSTKFKGKRLVTSSSGTRWGNIRHGKQLRFNAHKNILDKIFAKYSIKSVFDDGSNRGTFAKYCQKKKLRYTGCEPDLLCFSNYQNIKYKILNTKTENYKKKKKFDFVYSVHTLEHVENLTKHLNKISNIMGKNSILFLEVPNTNQIYYENKIYEEYFIDKHLNHFTPKVILQLLEKFGFYSEQIISNQFNMILILRKKKIKSSKKLQIVDVVNNYYLSKKKTEIQIKNITKKINKIKKKNKVIFFGAGRILNTFFENGLDNNNVVCLIDNFLYGKVKSNNNLKIYNSTYLNKLNKNNIIFIFAREAEESIYLDLKKMNFKFIKKISDFF